MFKGHKLIENLKSRPKPVMVNGVLVEAVTGDKLLAELEDILSTRTAATIDGTLVDLQTAMLVSQVASGLNPENKTKFLSKGIAKAAEIAWKLVK